MQLLSKILIILLLLIAISIVIIIHQNTKVPQNLGVIYGNLSEIPDSPNAVSTQTKDIDKKVEPMIFKGNLKESFEKILKAVKEYDGDYEIIKSEKNYLYIVFTTKIMKFKDDAEFYFDENEKIIHFRSKSRSGYSDMGLNKKRYKEIKLNYENIN